MTTTYRHREPDAVFAARLAVFEAAPDAPESYAATVERMARAMAESLGFIWTSDHPQSQEVCTYYRRLAEAALRVVTEPADGAAQDDDGRLPLDPRSGVHTSCDKYIGVEPEQFGGTYLSIWEPARSMRPERSLWANLSPRALQELIGRLRDALDGAS